MNIRILQHEDFPILQAWWKERGEAVPGVHLMPPNSFVIESEPGKPIASMCLILTDLVVVAYCAHFVSDKNADPVQRREAVKELFRFITMTAKDKGVWHLMAFGYQPKLTDRFKELGFRHTACDLNSFVYDL